MGSTRRRWQRAWLLRVLFVLATCFAAGLVTAGVISGAGPLAALSSVADTGTTATDSTSTSTTDPAGTTGTTSTETTDTQPVPTPASGSPTLVSDKPDYAPGETVTLTGENWAPAEGVHLTVNDDQEKPWTYQADLVASTSGTIWHQFQLPITFAATYSATATGPLSGTATTTFTDGNVKARTNASGFTFELDWVMHNGTPAVPKVTCNSSNTTSGSEPTVGFSGGGPTGQFSKGVASFSSIVLIAANTASDGSIFTGWTGETSSDTFVARPDPHEICVTGNFTGNRTYVANYAPNTAPTATAVSDSTNEDTLKAIGLSGSDAQQCDLNFSIVTGPANGSLSSISKNSCASGSPNTDTASVTYTPNLNFNGSDSFTYKVNDGSLDSSVATVSLTVNPVNDAPSFTKGADQTVNEDSGAQSVTPWATAISAGPSNESSQTVSFAVTSNSNPSLFSTGPAVSPSGTLTYTPAANAFGSATVGVKITDNGGTANGGVDASADQTFVITVNGVNDAPSFTKGADQTVNEDSGAQSVSGWATAIAAGPNESGQTVNFIVTNNTNSGLFSAGPAVASNGTLTYTPAADAFGSATITLKAKDDGGTGNGGVDESPTQSFLVTVNPVNDAPSFTKGADQTVNEDSGAQSVTPWATAISAGPSNESSQTVSFAVTSNSNPSLFSTGPAVSPSGTLTYTPAANAFGSATIGVRITDNGGTANGGVDTSAVQTFLITVREVNDPPTAATDAASVAEDDAGGVLVDVLANDSAGPANESSQTLTIDSVVSPPTHGTAVISAGQIKYTPTQADFFGPDSFTYKVCDDGTTAGSPDPKCDTGTVNVTVTPVNDSPKANTDSASVPEDSATGVLVDVRANDSVGPANESGQTLTVTAVTQGAHGSVAIEAGQVRYIPTDANYVGPDSFTYTIQDNGQSGDPLSPDFKSDTGTVNVTVTPVNDPPDAVNDAKTVAEDSGATAIDVLVNDSAGPANESSQTLTITGVSNPPNGTAAIDDNGTPGNPADDKVTYTPDTNYFGPDSFTYTIQDDGQSGDPLVPDFKSDTGTVNVTVTAVNDAPVVTAGADKSGSENDTISVTASFTDTEAGDTHTCSINWGDGSPASSGTVVEPSGATPGTCSGSHQYLDDNPTATAVDDYTVTITVTDNGTTNGTADPKSDSDTLKVTISNVAPLVTGMTGPSGPLQLGSSASVTTNYTDVGSQDTHKCTYSWDDGSPNTTVDGTGAGTGSCSASHTYAGAGVYTVDVTVKDDDTGSATSKYEFVVIYDPSAGFVTGGGWIMSPVGAYTAGPSLTGKATFGFVSKYKKGATVPEGQTEFQLHFASFNFHSTSYQWLVVTGSGTKAQYKGYGTINGSGNYGFLLTAYDGSPDRFRIKITEGASVVYDNKVGASDDIDAADPQEISGGSIVIHKAK